MEKMKKGFTLIVLVLMAFLLNAQDTLFAPQKIVIDYERNRYLVSNFNSGGDLVEIDSMGNLTTLIANAGLIDAIVIVGDTLYGSSYNATVKGYDLNTELLVADIDFSNVGVQIVVSGLVSDSLGFIYASERFGNRIFKIDPKTQEYWEYVNLGDFTLPNGLLYEKEKNRILVCIDDENPPILALNLSDSTITTLITTNLAGSDGIAKDRDGNYYVTGYELSGIYKYDPDFVDDPELIFEGNAIIYPTYNEEHNSLLFTYYLDDNWGELFLDILLTHIDLTGENEITTIDENEGTLQIYADIAPLNAADTTITWSVENNTATATISQTGLLQASGNSAGNGTVMVVATANDFSSTRATLEVTITNQNIAVEEIIITGQNGDTIIDINDGTLQMHTEVLPADATDNTVIWSIVENGTASATISNTGLIKAISVNNGNGTVVVNAISNDGSNIIGSKTITIKNPLSITNLLEKNLSIYPNPSHSAIQLSYTLKIAGNVSMYLCDNSGKVLINLENQWKHSGKHQMKYNVDKLQSGTYHIILHSNELSGTKSFIKK